MAIERKVVEFEGYSAIQVHRLQAEVVLWTWIAY